jgi:hypothetical protein
MRHLCLLLAITGCAGPIRILDPTDLLPHGVVEAPADSFNPIRPFGSVDGPVDEPVVSEEVTVTADDPYLYYPNGETIHVDLDGVDSARFMRRIRKRKNGELSVDYDFTPAALQQPLNQ